jgi:hypothetical protein
VIFGAFGVGDGGERDEYDVCQSDEVEAMARLQMWEGTRKTRDNFM